MTDSNTPESTTPKPIGPEPSFNLATVIEDAKKVIANPVGFYREMPTTGGYAISCNFCRGHGSNHWTDS